MKTLKKIVILFSTLYSLSSNAAIISYSYEGSVNSMFYSDCNGYSSSGSCNSWDINNLSSSSFYQGNDFSVGDTFSGNFSYDSETPLTSMSSDGSQAVYLNAITQYGFSIGTYVAPSNSLPLASFGNASVVNDRNGSLSTIDSFFTTQGFSSNDWFSSITVDFQDNTAQAFDNFALPTTLDISDFSYPYFHMAFLRKSDGDQLHLKGRVTALNPVSVPEPNTLLLSLVGLFILTFKRYAGQKI
jgi:hypothetical protein